ncbi:MAG: LutC/YkgG family protein [Syntrophales bacterium]
MIQSGRDEILGRLKATPKTAIPGRPFMPPLEESSLARKELVDRFAEMFTAETGIVHRAKDNHQALERLTEIVRQEGLKSVMVSTDDVVASLDLPAWGRNIQVKVMSAKDFKGRDDFKDAVFDRVEAGITGVDFAIAESGTLGLMHDENQARLTSLAPILHIAIVPVERILPVYEPAIERVFSNKEKLPSQFVFITGPSMTGDIQGLLFKGMHGPRKVIVILVG